MIDFLRQLYIAFMFFTYKFFT